LKTFFEWLSKQKGYKKIIVTDIEYLNLPRGEERIATQAKGKLSPSLEEVKKVIESIKGTTEVEMRDRALLSLMFLTGARISAILSLPISSFDREKLTIEQNPKNGVKTKFSKRFVSSLIPFSYKEPLGYFLDWIDYLQSKKGFGPKDPIFPATKTGMNEKNLGYFSTGEVGQVFWESNSSARKIFEKRFVQAGVPYYHPHTFRHLLVKEISKLPLTEEEKKAISQSLGHEDVGTTFGSYGYGQIEEDRQIEIIRKIDFEGKKREDKHLFGREDIKELAKLLKEEQKNSDK
jgi:integrase/recombinase XerD